MKVEDAGHDETPGEIHLLRFSIDEPLEIPGRSDPQDAPPGIDGKRLRDRLRGIHRSYRTIGEKACGFRQFRSP